MSELREQAECAVSTMESVSSQLDDAQTNLDSIGDKALNEVVEAISNVRNDLSNLESELDNNTFCVDDAEEGNESNADLQLSTFHMIMNEDSIRVLTADETKDYGDWVSNGSHDSQAAGYMYHVEKFSFAWDPSEGAFSDIVINDDGSRILHKTELGDYKDWNNKCGLGEKYTQSVHRLFQIIADQKATIKSLKSGDESERFNEGKAAGRAEMLAEIKAKFDA
jgi:hypothetical protein